MLSRRNFLVATARSAGTAAGLAATSPPLLAWLGGQPAALLKSAPRARYWTTAAAAGANCSACHKTTPGSVAHPHDPTVVRCLLCAQSCDIKPGQSGRCRARANVNGELRSLVY